MPGEFFTLYQHIQMGVLLFSLVLALLQCFFGFKFLKFWITLAGLILGAIVGGAIVAAFMPERPWYAYAIIALLAVIFAILSYKLYVVGVFIFLGAVAAAGAYAFLSSFNIDPTVLLVSCAIIFIVAGVLGVRYQKPLIIIITSIAGAVSAVRILSEIIPLVKENEGYRIIILGALAGTGMLMQFLLNKSHRRKRR